MTIQEQLIKAKENKNLLAVYRDDMAQVVDYAGFPVVMGREILVLTRESDFTTDGYVAMRNADITYIEQVDDNPFIAKVLQGEGVYSKVSAPKLTEGESWHKLLSGVQASFRGWLTAESMSEDDGQCFFLGKIARVDNNNLYMKTIDATGKQNKEEATVPLQDLVTVTFGGRYLGMYEKYTK